MAEYLITSCETYRVNNEKEAEKVIEKAKNDNHFELKKYSSQKKQKTSKGEILDEWILVTLIKQFTNEKEPSFRTKIEYSNDIESAFQEV